MVQHPLIEGRCAKWRRLSQAMSEDAPLSPGMVASVMPTEMLHDDETVLILTKPSLWFVVITSFRFLLTTLLLGILAVKTLPETQINLSSKTVATIVALIAAARVVWAMLVWSSHTYMLTNQRIVTIKGVLNTSMVQSHLNKIQRTVLYRPLYLRFFGIGTIGLASAATTTFDATWVMIARPLQTHEAIVAAIRRIQGGQNP